MLNNLNSREPRAASREPRAASNGNGTGGARRNSQLHAAKIAKNDEFYTQFADIQNEVNAYVTYNPDVFRDKTILLPCDDPEWSNFTKFFAQNFEAFGLKKLISTSYAAESKTVKFPYQPTLFEKESPQFDAKKTRVKGKIFTLTRRSKTPVDINNLKWKYLKGDGDFRSDEVKQLRDEADIIITNPPFSLFREFLAWITEAKKQFLIIGNMNAIAYQEIFPLIKKNQMWLGATNFNMGMYFLVPKGFVYASTYKFERELNGNPVNRVPGVCWFTNLDHGKRHQPLQLMTTADNLKFSKHKEIREQGYPKYDNYNAIEVSFTDAIPSDYNGVMGVPVSFLDKYCPEQFEIIGSMASTSVDEFSKGYPFVKGERKYARILIRRKI
jgi:hypothetical protein